MGVVLLDSVVIVAFLDRSDAFHNAADRRLRALANQERLIVSAVSYAELLTGVTLGHHDEQVARGFFDELIDSIVPVDKEVAERAAELRGMKKSLKMPDALTLATADCYPADLVLSGDAGWARVPGCRCQIEVIEPT